MTLVETTRIEASPKEVFRLFERMDDQQYRAWHPDHITFR